MRANHVPVTVRLRRRIDALRSKTDRTEPNGTPPASSALAFALTGLRSGTAISAAPSGDTQRGWQRGLK